jgi:hypothetical protein
LRSLGDHLVRRFPAWNDTAAIEPSARAALHDVLEQPLPEELAQPYFAMEDARRATLRVQAVADLASIVSAAWPLAHRGSALGERADAHPRTRAWTAHARLAPGPDDDIADRR